MGGAATPNQQIQFIVAWNQFCELYITNFSQILSVIYAFSLKKSFENVMWRNGGRFVSECVKLR